MRCTSYTGTSKALFTNVEETEKALEEAETWFFDNVDDNTVGIETYAEKFAVLQTMTRENGKAYFEKEREKEEKLERELAAAYAEKQKEEKEDHDNRKLPTGERLRMAEKQRLEGNELFKAGLTDLQFCELLFTE